VRSAERQDWKVTELVSKDLAQYKSAPPVSPRKFNSFDDECEYSEFFKPYLIGNRFTSQDIYQKIAKAFQENKLEKVRFEFALAVLSSGEYGIWKGNHPILWNGTTIP
jgi:hypothetical protein